MRDFEQDRRICEAATPGKWEIRYPEEYQGENEPPAWNGEIHVFVEGTDSWVGLLGYNGYGKENAEFMVAAREGWPAALDEIQSLKRQLQVAATLLSCERCPGEKDGSHCSKDAECVDCWLEYWRQKANFKDKSANSDDKAGSSKDSGTFQSGNDQSGKAGEAKP